MAFAAMSFGALYYAKYISPCSVIIGMEWCGYIYKKGWTNTLNEIYYLDKFTALSMIWSCAEIGCQIIIKVLSTIFMTTTCMLFWSKF